MSEITIKYLMALLLACAATGASADTIVGRVVGVADGDTITVLDAEKVQHKVRVAGIDAPEKKQAFGQRSKASMSDLVFGKDVTVLTSKRDRYGRIIGKVMVRSILHSARVSQDPGRRAGTAHRRDGVVVSPVRAGAICRGCGSL